MRDWNVETGDVRNDMTVAVAILEFVEKRGVLSVVMSDGLIPQTYTLSAFQFIPPQRTWTDPGPVSRAYWSENGCASGNLSPTQGRELYAQQIEAITLGTGDAGLPVGNGVVLADESRAVPVLTQNLGDHSGAWRNLAAVIRVAVANLRDDAGTDGVMVAARQQRSPGRRAQRRRVKPRVAQAACRQSVEIARWDQVAESAPLAVARPQPHDGDAASGSKSLHADTLSTRY